MRTHASPAVQRPTTSRASDKPRRFEQFYASVKAGSPGASVELRKVARSLFGDAAFDQTGTTPLRLSLGATQLRTLAEHPAKIEQAIKELQAQGALPKDTAKWSAADAARLYATSARQVLPPKNTVGITVATVNDDFATRRTNLPSVKADVLLVQEAKRVKARKVMSKEWGVNQDRSTEARAGSAVLWRRDALKATKSGLALGVEPGRAAMLTRYLSFTDVTIDGARVRMVSAHRPPKRFSYLWPAFDAHLVAFARRSKLPLVIGMDSNEHGGPGGVAKATGMKWVAPKGSIDGFLVSPGISVEKMWRLPKGSSDHQPVVARFRVPTPPE